MEEEIIVPDNTSVNKVVPIKTPLTKEQLEALKQRQLQEWQELSRSERVYDTQKAKFYANLQNFYNTNAFGAGMQGTQTRLDPTTEEGQRKIQSNFDYAKENANNVVTLAASEIALGNAIRGGKLLHNKYIK